MPKPIDVPLLFLAAASTLAAQTPGHRLFDAPVLRLDSNDEVELAGDVDGDGDIDLIAFTAVGQSAIKSSFRVFANDGAGRFTPGPPVAIPAVSGTWIALGDVDGDGLPDVLISSLTTAPSGAGLWLFRGAGGGAFAAPTHTPLAGNVYRLFLGDADGNGQLDALAVHFSGLNDLHLVWLAGSAAPALVPLSTTVLNNFTLGDAAVLDADGDGSTDLALLEVVGGTWTLQVRRTTPTGLVPYGSLPLGGGLSMSLVPGRWDNDNDDDLLLAVTTGVAQSALTPLWNQGGGVFAAGAPQALTGMSIGRLFAGDLDGDGDSDLLARGSSSSTYSVARVHNQGGVFSWSRFRSIPQPTLTLGAGLADLDGDGVLDYADAKALWFGTGDVATADAPATVSLADWDGDGDLDSVQVQVLGRHDGALGFAATPGFWPALPANQFYVEPAHVADFDGDGAPEMVVPWVQQILTQQTFLGMRRLEANGDDQLVDRGFAAALPLRMNHGLVDDLDGDGDPDVLDNQGAWLNDGTGQFTFVPLALQGFRPIAKGDVDGDGDTDFLAVNTSGPTATAVLLRTAPLAFTVVVLAPAQGSTVELQSAVLVDLDDDGDLDVACRERTATSQTRTLVFANNGGVFTQVLQLPEHGRVAAGDLDGDGRTDLVVVASPLVHVFRRLPGVLAYAAPVAYAFSGPTGLADADQDGDLDLVGGRTLLNLAVPPSVAGSRRQYGVGGLGLDGRRPLLAAVGPIRTAQTLTMRANRALGGTVGALFFSTQPANVPDVLPGVTAYIASIDVDFVLLLGGAAGQPGVGAADTNLPLPPGMAGTTLYAQCVVLDVAAPGWLVHSNGVELLIGQ
ncbi:MAG: VCBS repeat-containing protein [Planctomycetes bacterium]|nr:VCBS repeat-containing protein [Planctomycetota bacterium]